MLSLIKRNIYVFIKDKTAVFFSFMAVFVVFFLYICFLKDAMSEPLKQQFPTTAEEVCNCWIMAGTLGIITLATSLSVLGILIHDRKENILDDFQITPISTLQLTLAYLLSTIFITFAIALCTLAIAQWYIVIQGGAWFSLLTYLKLLGVLLLSITACTCMLYVLLSFFVSDTSFSNVTTIIGTLSGFLMGIYVPIGALPSFLQHAIRLFFPSHAASLLRSIMLEDVLTKSALPSSVRTWFDQQFGLVFYYGEHLFHTYESIVLLCVCGLSFFFLATLRMRKLRSV